MQDLRVNPFEDFRSFDAWEDFADEGVAAALDDGVVEELEFGLDPEFDAEFLAQARQAHQFLANTPALTASEQAELLGAAVETRSRGGGRRRRGTDFGAIARGIQTGLSVFQTGAQIAGGLATAFGGNSRTARNFSLWANRLGQGAGQVGGFLQAFRGGRIPGLPGGGARPGAPAPRVTRVPVRRAAPTRQVVQQRPVARPAAGAQLNATALMGLLMNPQVIQAIRTAAVPGRGGPRRVEVQIPDGDVVRIPVAAVIETIRRLAEQAVVELNALTTEDEAEIPEYILGYDGEFLVDPARAADRAALVLHLLRLDGEARRLAESDLVGSMDSGEIGDDEWDESELWAREAGFDD